MEKQSELIEWRYDEPTQKDQENPGYVSQFTDGSVSKGWFLKREKHLDTPSKSIRWTILSVPPKLEECKKIEDFCSRWKAEDLRDTHSAIVGENFIVVTDKGELHLYPGFEGDVLELFKDVRITFSS